MRATGVIRRIDDLGRIVIPKEIRRSLRMREGDPLEIFTDRGGEVILKKYSIMAGLTSLAKDCAASIYKSAGVRCAVCDGEKITAFGGEKKYDCENSLISPEISFFIQKRTPYYRTGQEDNPIRPCENSPFICLGIMPLVSANGDCPGALMLLGGEREILTDDNKTLLQFAASLLVKNIE